METCKLINLPLFSNLLILIWILNKFKIFLITLKFVVIKLLMLLKFILC